MKSVVLVFILSAILVINPIQAQVGGPCTGKIKSVFLAEDGICSDLAMVDDWLEKLDVSNGILLFYNVTAITDTVALHSILRRHIDTIIYNTPPLAANAHPLIAHNMMALRNWDVSPHPDNVHPGGDAAVPIPRPAPAPSAGLTTRQSVQPPLLTLFLGNDNNFDLSHLSSDTRLMKVLKPMGIDTVVNRDNLLQGGDMLWAGNHLILGRGSLSRFSSGAISDTAKAADSIRRFYGLSPDQTIDFLLADDPGLYHLDLFVTYAGLNRQGKNQFFIGYIGNHDQITDTTKTKMMIADLRNLYPRLNALLTRLYPGGFQLDSVPIFKDHRFVSPLNGLTSCINGKPTYYMPYPSGIADPPELQTEEITTLIDRAYSIISSRINTVKVNVDVNDLMGGTVGGGQSLHCSISVISRE